MKIQTTPHVANVFNAMERLLIMYADKNHDAKFIKSAVVFKNVMYCTDGILMVATNTALPSGLYSVNGQFVEPLDCYITDMFADIFKGQVYKVGTATNVSIDGATAKLFDAEVSAKHITKGFKLCGKLASVSLLFSGDRFKILIEGDGYKFVCLATNKHSIKF